MPQLLEAVVLAAEMINGYWRAGTKEASASQGLSLFRR